MSNSSKFSYYVVYHSGPPHAIYCTEISLATKMDTWEVVQEVRQKIEAEHGRPIVITNWKQLAPRSAQT